MKVKVDDVVYTIYRYQIYEENVGYVGRDSFIIDGYEDKNEVEYYYEDYGTVWFKDLEKAKKYLIKTYKKYGCKAVIKKVDVDLWEVWEEDD